jgi:hypothetical protein
MLGAGVMLHVENVMYIFFDVTAAFVFGWIVASSIEKAREDATRIPHVRLCELPSPVQSSSGRAEENLLKTGSTASTLSFKDIHIIKGDVESSQLLEPIQGLSTPPDKGLSLLDSRRLRDHANDWLSAGWSHVDPPIRPCQAQAILGVDISIRKRGLQRRIHRIQRSRRTIELVLHNRISRI